MNQFVIGHFSEFSSEKVKSINIQHDNNRVTGVSQFSAEFEIETWKFQPVKLVNIRSMPRGRRFSKINLFKLRKY